MASALMGSNGVIAGASAAPRALPFLQVLPAPRVESGTDGGLHAVTPARILDTRIGLGAVASPVGPGQTINLQVLGVGGVPATDVKAVVINVTATQPTAASFVTVFPTGGSLPTSSNLNFIGGQTVPNLVIAKVGDGGRVSLFNQFGTVHLIADVSAYYDSTAQLEPLTPARILDTRTGQGGISGAFGGEKSLVVSGQGGVPIQGASAVVANITVTQPTALSFLTAYPSGGNRPNASNINLVPGDTRPNLAIIQLNSTGKIDLYISHGKAHVIVDVLAYVSAPPNMTALLDKVDDNRTTFGPTPAETNLVAVNGQTYFNSLYTSSVGTTPRWTEYNLGRDWTTFSTTFGFDDNRSTATSNVRFRILGDGNELANSTVSFGEVVPVTVDVTGILRIRFEITSIPNASDGIVFIDPKLSVTSTAPQTVEFNSSAPVRVLDTREGLGAAERKLRPGDVVDLVVVGKAGLPVDGVGAIAVNLTVTETEGPGFITAYPSGGETPGTSSLNYTSSGQSIANFAIVPVGPNGRISLSVSVSGTHLIADIAGWFPAEGSQIRTTTTAMSVALDKVDDNRSTFGPTPSETNLVAVDGQTYFDSLYTSSVGTTPRWTEYNLGRDWTTFSTTFGFDDNRSTATSKVRFRILGDGNELANSTVSFGEVVPVTVDVTGILRIRFEITSIPNASDGIVFIDPTISR